MRKPSTKWFTATLTALAGWCYAFFVEADMHWTDPIKATLIALVLQAVLSYFVPNSQADLERQTPRPMGRP